MSEKEIVAKNLKSLRDANGFKQDYVADYLGIGRSAYSNYEAGTREAPLDVMERLADLYGCELFFLYNEDENVLKGVLVTAFRVDDLSAQDMAQVAAFKRMVKNYLKMNTLLSR